MDTKQALAQYITTELLDTPDEVGEDDNLLAGGMVDSLGMLRLMGFIEDEIGVQVPPEDFTIENFKTIGAMAQYLDGRLNAATDAAQ